MDVQAFYKALARVLSERTEAEIKVKEIEYVREYDSINQPRVFRAYNKSA